MGSGSLCSAALKFAPEQPYVGLAHQCAAVQANFQRYMPLRAAADHQFAAGQLGAHAQLRYPGDAEAFQGHAFQAVGHGGLIDGGKAQLTLTQKTIYRAPEKRPGAVRQQRYADVTFQIEQRLALGIRRTHREHLGLAQVQRREDFRSICIAASGS